MIQYDKQLFLIQMDNLLKTELVKIFLHFSIFFMEPFPYSMKAFNNELHVFLHLNKLTNLKKKKKILGPIHLLAHGSEIQYG